MKNDWLSILRMQGDLAKSMAEDVPKALDDPKLTLDQASRLYNAVEQGAQEFDRIVTLMNEEDLDEPLYEAADALEDMWSELSVAAANKVRVMQGLDPIEFIAEEDDD